MARLVISMLLLIAFTGFTKTESTTIGTTGETGGTVTTANMTTDLGTTSNVTTKAMSSSTVTPEITAPSPTPSIPTFIAQTDAGDVCMIIAIDAEISFETETGGMQKSKVPADASIVDGPAECPEDLNAAYIELLWIDDDKHEWTLGLSFEATETDYTMVLVNGSYSEDPENGTGPFLNVWEDKNFDFASAPLGNSLHCTHVELEHINFLEYKFQPFAQRNGGKFGKVVECADEGGLSTMWIIIIAAVGGAILIFGLIAIGCCCKSKRDNYQSV